MAKKTKSPAYQWYPKDVLSSVRVQQLTLAEEGAYRRALDFCWLNGELPADPRLLSKVVGKGCTPAIAKVVAALFVRQGDVLTHERLNEEREKQRIWSEKSAEGGKKSRKTQAVQVNQQVTKSEPPLQGSLHDSGNQNETLHLQFASSSAFPINTNNILLHPHEVFAKKLFSENGQLDKQQIELQLADKREITPTDVAEYNAHLSVAEKKHIHWGEWKQHLRNWLNRRPSGEKSNTGKPAPFSGINKSILENYGTG